NDPSAEGRRPVPRPRHRVAASSLVRRLDGQERGMATISEVWAAYEQARGRWSGCDWPTRFGSLRLDLEGVSSLQARAAARRWRAIAAGEVACRPTAQEGATLAAMGLCLRLRLPAVLPGEGGLTPPRPAPRPPRHRV